MEQTWATEITPDRVVRLEEELAWALHQQNARFVRWSHVLRRWVAVGCAVLVALTVLALIAIDPGAPRRMPLLFALAGLLGIVCAALAVVPPRERTWSKRVAGRMLARTAGRIVGPLARMAPVTIDYRLDAGVVYARCTALRLERRLDLAKPGLVLHTDAALFVFRRQFSLNPSATLHATGADREAVLAALQAAGVPCEAVTGPSAGYADALPVARVR